jgi:hypothetical protein
MVESENPYGSSNQSDESDNTQRGFGTVVRIYWTLISNVALGILAIGISCRHSGINSLDIFYLMMVVLLIAVRYCDIKYFAGSSDKRATMAYWRKYVLLLLLITGGMWLAAHGLSLLRK